MEFGEDLRLYIKSRKSVEYMVQKVLPLNIPLTTEEIKNVFTKIRFQLSIFLRYIYKPYYYHTKLEWHEISLQYYMLFDISFKSHKDLFIALFLAIHNNIPITEFSCLITCSNTLSDYYKCYEIGLDYYSENTVNTLVKLYSYHVFDFEALDYVGEIKHNVLQIVKPNLTKAAIKHVT